VQTLAYKSVVDVVVVSTAFVLVIITILIALLIILIVLVIRTVYVQAQGTDTPRACRVTRVIS
jgi:hypothetical protein